MQRHSVLVDDILFCVLDLLNSYWESVQSPRILTVISWVISPVISRLLRECSLFMTLKSARYFSALSCVSVWNWYQTRIGRLYCVCCVRSPIIFCSPSGVLFFFAMPAESRPSFYLKASPQLVVAQWPKLRVSVSFDIDNCIGCAKHTFYYKSNGEIKPLSQSSVCFRNLAIKILTRISI